MRTEIQIDTERGNIMQQDWTYMLTIYETGSFSAAARKLYMTQPALSIAVRKLEAEIGEPLFYRNRKPVQPTPAGEILLHTIEKQKLLEKELREELDDLKDGLHAQIRIGASPYITGYILPEILIDFSRKFPDIHLELLEDSSASLMPMLDKQELDLTFSCNADYIGRYPGIEAFEDRILLAVPKQIPLDTDTVDHAYTAQQIRSGAHLGKDVRKISLDRLKDLEFIMLRNLHDRSQAMFQEAGYEPKIKVQLSQLVSAYRLARNGFAAAFVSDRIVSMHDDSLYFFIPDSKYIVREYYMLFPNKEYMPAGCRLFMEYWAEAKA